MSLPDAEIRPLKRIKMDNNNSNTSGGPASQKAKQRKNKYRAQKARDPNQSRSKPGHRQQPMFSASGIHNDDVGIFVTSDKGQEKKCLQELSDLLGEFFDEDLAQRRSETVEDKTAVEAEEEVDIEADIAAELDALRPHAAEGDGVGQKLSLVTLDIPCVSFVRFPIRSAVDPVEVVRKLCLTASERDAKGPRSRYIKRLTPVSLLRKTLNDGLDTLCSQILPNHFSNDAEPQNGDTHSTTDQHLTPKPYKFAIRPTIRNNNKIDRDVVIRTVADKVAELGKHTVDLKGYDKLILVDVYRNVVGMSVVGSEYETMKKYNLAEIHASHLGDGEEKQ
ncbi:hypothetical protein H2200_011747 [Cladophialophora chaetospira]|uniref:THUMP domain-containing protein n=1 Tax=Cladophialophora chaetospira TaxID=386627 RepID=A0AA39CCU2_9EURO|nr:hypothetical protein H2200_011747 [Cladophialophora chaetospira]